MILTFDAHLTSLTRLVKCLRPKASEDSSNNNNDNNFLFILIQKPK